MRFQSFTVCREIKEIEKGGKKKGKGASSLSLHIKELIYFQLQFCKERRKEGDGKAKYYRNNCCQLFSLNTKEETFHFAPGL